MAEAVTQSFEQMVLEVAFDPAAPTAFTKVCGMSGVTVNRNTNVGTTNVPDCDDESLPDSIRRSVEGLEVTVSGTGVWAKSSHDKILQWYYSGGFRQVRISNNGVDAVGEIVTETGAAILSSMSNERTKGQVVSAEISIEFDGTPTLGLVA